jgi:uncharacterized protein CbrC (UPF0167 family)
MIDVTVQLAEEVCCRCGMFFAYPQDYKNRRRKDHQAFYCPAGHEQYYYVESEEEKLRNKLTAAYARESSLSGELKRLKTRIRNGVCPCCNRSFKNIGRHIKSKHPEFKV